MNAWLLGMIRARVPEDRCLWLDPLLARTAFDSDAFVRGFSLVPRKLGTAAVSATEAERSSLEGADLRWVLSGTTIDELGRIALLERASVLGGAEAPAFIAECFRQGDAREKRAVVRALSLLPDPSRFVETGTIACRTSVQTVFEAIACENPYPASHFIDESFNQMVLKCLFVGVALDRVLGLSARRTPELARMAADYASERRAAGRTVPADIDRVLSEGVRK